MLCTRCNKEKDISLIHIKKDGIFGKICNKCTNQQKIYVNNHKDNYLGYGRKSYHNNREERLRRMRLASKTEKYQIRKRKYHEKYIIMNKEKIKLYRTSFYQKVSKPRNQKPEWRYRTYMTSAKRLGSEFAIFFEDFMKFWNKPCSYCGIEMNNIGLDKVEGKKGYTLDNIVSCCTMCNFMKKNFPKDIFIEKCRMIANHNK